MAQLTVRKLDESLVRALRVRAAHAGRSAEAEVREILKEALVPSERSRALVEHLLAIPVDDCDDELFPRLEGEVRGVEL